MAKMAEILEGGESRLILHPQLDGARDNSQSSLTTSKQMNTKRANSELVYDIV